MKKILIYGASGHGKVVADALSLISGIEVAGFIDDDEGKLGSKVGALPVLGTGNDLPRFFKDGIREGIVAIGENGTRLKKARKMTGAGFRFFPAVHPGAIVASDVLIGPGTVVMGGAVINSGTRIGEHAIINTGATIDHDCSIAAGVHVAPGVNLAGHVRVGSASLVGIGSSVIPGIEIGDNCTVGAGAVVVEMVPSGVTVLGNPAKKLGIVTKGN